jgi:uncharacterized protein involved in outer membrane biogenesis
MKPSVQIALLSVIILVLASVIGMILWLDAAIKAGIERIAPQVTGSAVTLDAVTVSLLTGTVQIGGLTIGNPKGFRTPLAFRVESIRVRLRWRTFLSSPLVIEAVEIVAPQVMAEGIGAGNLRQLHNNVQGFAAGIASGRATDGPAGSSPPPRKYSVNRLEIIHGRAVVTFGGGGSTKELEIAIPDLHVTDMGTPGGATAEQLAMMVADVMLDAALKPVTQPFTRTGESVEHAVSNVRDGVKNLPGK